MIQFIYWQYYTYCILNCKTHYGSLSIAQRAHNKLLDMRMCQTDDVMQHWQCILHLNPIFSARLLVLIFVARGGKLSSAIYMPWKFMFTDRLEKLMLDGVKVSLSSENQHNPNLMAITYSILNQMARFRRYCNYKARTT